MKNLTNSLTTLFNTTLNVAARLRDYQIASADYEAVILHWHNAGRPRDNQGWLDYLEAMRRVANTCAINLSRAREVA